MLDNEQSTANMPWDDIRADLDPGIVETVKRMRDAGFRTFDSGDYGGWNGSPHVHAFVRPGEMLSEVARLRELFPGAVVQAFTGSAPGEGDEDPVISLLGVNDDVLFGRTPSEESQHFIDCLHAVEELQMDLYWLFTKMGASRKVEFYRKWVAEAKEFVDARIAAGEVEPFRYGKWGTETKANAD